MAAGACGEYLWSGRSQVKRYNVNLNPSKDAAFWYEQAAAVGVSLCEAEASVAAPLTSRRASVGCMLTVIAEGRAALVTSFIIFKFIVIYAFVQVFAINVMYSYGLRIGNYQVLLCFAFWLKCH